MFLFKTSLLLLFCFGLVLGQSNARGSAIGDVVYSVLAPVEFQTQHKGDGKWACLNGGDTLIDGTKVGVTILGQITKWKILPDARGVFVRSMNEGRSSELGDPDGNRKVGEYQKDQLQTHRHGIYPKDSEAFPAHVRGYWYDLTHKQTFKNHMDGDAASSEPLESNHGLETRPRNIALYIYIKASY